MIRFASAALLCLLLCGLALAEDITYGFEAETDGFTVLSGKGAVTRDVAAPLAGTGSLRVALDAGAAEVRVASPAFAVKPWTVYRLADKRTVPAGMSVQPMIQFADGDKWRDVTPTVDGDGCAFGTLPATQKARVTYYVRAGEKPTDRFILLDAVTITVKAEMVKEAGKNLFTDPSLEAATAALPAGWDTWVNKPEKAELGTANAHDGKQYLRVTGTTVYLALPYLEVKPNRLYRIRFWVRGEGLIYFGLHKLTENRVTRIGWSPAVVNEATLKPDTWQRVEFVVATENSAVRWLNPYMNMKGAATLEIDDLEAVTLDDAAAKAP